jgi:hypothetical protein
MTLGVAMKASAKTLVLGLCALASFGFGPAASTSAAVAQMCDASGYRLALQSLTGPPRADLSLRVIPRRTECEPPELLSKIEVTVFTPRGVSQRRVELNDVAAVAGSARVPLGRVARGQRVAVTLTFDPDVTLTGTARTLLKPDLVLTSVKTNKSSLSGRPFFVIAGIRERTRDVGTTAVVTVSAAGVAVASMPVAVRAGRRVSLKLPVTLTVPGRTRLTVSVTAANPMESSTRNNLRRALVSVTEFRFVPASVITPSFDGFGGQFNHHVYAAISRTVGVTDENVGEMERKMRALHPQFSRIFFTPAAFSDPDRMQSFFRTVQLAQSIGTTINITWQGGTLSVAAGTVQKFADVLIDLVRNRGITNFRWLTLQNEPNRTRMTPEQYEATYRALDPYIQSIRGQVRYMGGDLVRGPDVGPPNQQLWFDYMATHMADLLDAYSIHVFWDYWDIVKLQERLIEVRAIVDALPESARKPLYVAEYGVRGLRRINGVPQGDPGGWEDGTQISQTNISAFQHAWFDILATRLGYRGTSKWDSYFGKYDSGTQAYYFLGGPQNGWPEYPLYNLMRLLTTTVKREWQVVALDSVPDTSRLLTGFFGKGGQRTIVGLDTSGGLLNTVSLTASAYSIGGLPPSKKLGLLVWNEKGDGLVAPPKTVTSDPAGVVTITVPQHAVFVLTTMQVT